MSCCAVPAGAAALAAAIEANQTLEVLSINDNYLGTEGAAALGAALSKNKSLRELQIKGNELGEPTALHH